MAGFFYQTSQAITSPLWAIWAAIVSQLPALVAAIIVLIIGVFVGIIFNYDPRLSLLAGYAGTDILEGIYKSFAVQKVYVQPKSRK